MIIPAERQKQNVTGGWVNSTVTTIVVVAVVVAKKKNKNEAGKATVCTTVS